MVSPDLPISCTGFLPILIIPGHWEQLIRAISFSLPNILGSVEPTQFSPGKSMPGKRVLLQVKNSTLSAATETLTRSLGTGFSLFGSSWHHLASGEPASPSGFRDCEQGPSLILQGPLPCNCSLISQPYLPLTHTQLSQRRAQFSFFKKHVILVDFSLQRAECQLRPG